MSRPAYGGSGRLGGNIANPSMADRSGKPKAIVTGSVKSYGRSKKGLHVVGARVIAREFIFGAHAIALGVMTSSSAAGGHPYSGSVPMRAGALWNGFWSGRDIGENAAPRDHNHPTI